MGLIALAIGLQITLSVLIVYFLRGMDPMQTEDRLDESNLREFA